MSPEALATLSDVLAGPRPLPRLAYSAQEVCDILGLSRATVDRLLASGRLRSVSHTRRVLVPADELSRFLRV
jgi:excisionase family DNA binding protein